MPLPRSLWLWVCTLTASSLLPSVLRATPQRPGVAAAPLNLTFTRPSYRATIPENSVGKTYVVSEERMGIHLFDSRAELRFKIVSGDTDKIFKAEERPVGNFLFLLIRTRTGNSVVLNRERKDSFVLDVKATLALDDLLVECSTVVNVSVSDRNDLRPLFYQTSYQVAVAEDTRVHSSVVRIHADDADLGRGGQVYYRFRDPSSNFVIHPVTGVVTLTRPLRFSDKRSYGITVLAQDRGDRNPPSAAQLTVNVKQVNLHNPEIFVRHIRDFYDTPDTNIYAIVTVVDKDAGRNGQIDRLEIVDGDSNGHFRIKKVSSSTNNTSEFNIITYNLLNREKYSKLYNLTLRAIDKGTPPRQAHLSIDINVEQTSKKYPIFEKEIYEINILENAPVNSPIIRLKMSESDQMFRNEIHFEIVGGNEGGYFRIHSLTGMLYTSNTLDAEEKNLYIITVSALEQGKSGHSQQASAKVKIIVVDINDNDPIFETSSLDVSVTENEPPGVSIAKVLAKDRDSGENGYISYSIANLNPVPFEIDHFTGVVRTIEVLDYETMRRESLLYVRASDWGLPFRRETEMELKIRLRDINDNRPRFERVNCSGSLSRFSPVGSEIMSLAAIDFDSGNIITYRIVSKNSEGCFSLDLTSGIISLTCDLRYENFTERTLNTSASDGVHLSEINPIHIKIVNDMPYRGSHFDMDNFQCNETGVAKQLKIMLSEAAKSNIAQSPDHRDISIMPKRYGENVYPPDILNLPATVQINESVPLGSKVMRIQAKDRDLGYNGKLVFGVTSGDRDSLFRLDPETGVLKTIGHLDYEKETEYNLNIAVYDLGHPQKSSTSYLTVVILDKNDNPPRFQQPMASLRINENTANGTAVFKAIATDQDSAEHAQISYSLLTETDVFFIHPVTGVLYVNNPPDREKNDMFEVRIRATDQDIEDKHSVIALYAESVVQIHINDLNDNAPKFVKEFLTVRLMEDMPVGSVITVLEAVDEDLGVKGEVVYSMPLNNQSLQVDSLSGAVRLVRPLDYEERQSEVVKVTACDRGTPPLCASAELTVQVVDVDENVHTPQFEEFVVSASVAENEPPGVLVTTVKAVDADPPGEDSRLAYYITGGDGVGYFSIDDHGVIRTTATLDAEVRSHYWLTVFAQDHGVVPLRFRLEVYIAVRNVNDNVPLSTQPVYYPHIAENSPAHTSVLHLTADDVDIDPKQNLVFNITAGNLDNFFEIDHDTGLLTTTRNKIDREHQIEHDLEITVSDNGSPPLSSTTRVVVVVDDVNDNAPQFEQSLYHVVLPQTRHRQSLFQTDDESTGSQADTSWDHLDKTEMGEPLIRVLATDKDTGKNAEIEYSIKAGRGRGRFHIHPEKGMIYSHKPLSAGQEFELTVKATDHGFPNKSSTARIVVQVVAVAETNSVPYVKVRQQRVEVTEADPAGFLVALVQATDTSDHLWFRIVEGDSRGEFVMGGDPGSVLLARQLDCETQAEYNLTIAVSNGVHTVLTQLYVSVVEMNEHRPQFSRQQYVVSLSENAAVGQSVAAVECEDEDRGGEVLYDLLNARSPASLSLFRLHHETGVLSLAAPLDRETSTEHVLTVVARDQGTPTKRNFARLLVQVLDTNNHAPQWNTRLLQGFVLETAEDGATVLQLLATDKDQGTNAALQYSILSGNIGNTFEVHPTLGTLSLACQVDSSRISEYMLTVQATDSGSPPLAASVPVHILVITADETLPRFSKKSFTVQISENEHAGTLVEHLDVRASSSLFFEIIRGNTNNAFTVNPSTGSVTTIEPLDREQVDFYNLTISATNSGGGKAECSLLVNVLDKNDNAPQLLGRSYTGHVAEDAPVGALVQTNHSHPLVIYASDADIQSNALFRFRILEPLADKMFYIDGFTGTIRTRTQLDYESTPSVTFTVRVFDLGEPQLTSDVTATVHVTILDVNDCPPRFLQPEYNLSLLVPLFPDALLTKVEARDEDTAAVTRLRYTVLTGNQDGWVTLDPGTGELRARGLLSSPPPRRLYTLRLAVSDGRYSAQARVTVEWVEESGTLMFQHRVYHGYVTENTTKPVTITVLSVLGAELNQHIRFRVANPSPLFQLGQTSGALLTTGVPFDRESRDRYTVYAQAEHVDGDGVKLLAQTMINITVLDVNDNCPLFVNTPYMAAVSAGAEKHVPFTRVLAIDLDEGENGEVRYELTRGHGELFRVDRKTGDISLKQALQSSQRSYTIIITAYDGGVTPCSTEVSLHVTVLEDSAPQFDRQLYTVTVPESLPPHSLLPLKLTAQAPFSHPVLYSIPDGEQTVFSIDVTAGALFTADSLDYETAPLVEVTVRATDSVTGEMSEAQVSVVLSDVNDNAPTFPLKSYNISLLESATVGALVTVIKANDKDTGLNGLVVYSISPQVGAIRVDPSDGSMFLNYPLDRELNSTYHLVLTASDNGFPKLSTSADVWLLVLDVNDNPPKFERPSYSCRLSVEAKSGQLVTVVRADDPDQEPLRYSLASDTTAFRVSPYTGVISVFNTVQLAKTEQHLLNVSVSDGVHTSFCRVVVHVASTNQHAPVFSANQYEASVEENQPASSYVTTISATDADRGSHGKLTYSIPSASTGSLFYVDPETGVVRAGQVLDRELTAVLEVPVLATDGAGWADFSTVNVAVSDVNDNAPEFHFPEYHTCISPNLTADSVFLKVKARDKDIGPAGLVEYSIYNLQSRRVKNMFGINPQTGSVVLLQAAAQYQDQHFQFFVRASDNGLPPLWSDAAVHVYIMRSGDTPPTFHRRDHHVFVSEDASPGTVVAQVKLVAPMQVQYRLLGELSQFSVDTEGLVRLTAQLDRETIPSITLGVLASRPPLSGFTELHVSVVDVNDCPPRFQGATYAVNVAENVPEGTPIVRVVAEDDDEGSSGEVRYSLNSSVFTVDPYSGWVSTVSLLDRELTPRHTVLLTAFDNGDPPLSSTAVLHVDLLDYNDCPPVFSESSYVASVREDAVPGTAVLQFAVSDPDGGALDFYITDGDPQSQFSVRSTGQVYLSKSLDRESRHSYDLTVVVTDSKFVVQNSVHIDVTDVNDNQPECPESHIRAEVAEDAVPGVTVLVVPAHDPDLDSQLRYHLAGTHSNHFFFNQITGELKTAVVLDRETVADYSLVAHVQDRETPGWECTSQLIVVVNDVNDNPPVFSSTNYTAAVPRDVPPGSFVTILHATDADSGLNKRVRYSLSSADGDLFRVDPVSGLVQVARPIETGHGPRYSMNVQASDLGTPPLSTAAQLTVLIVDVNDNPPEFSTRSYHAQVSEAAPLGTEVVRISVTALEDVVYSIIAGNEFGKFAFEPQSDRLVVAEPLDYEEAQQYLLTVLATDVGERPLSTHATVNISVSDVNDNAPLFSQSSYSAEVSEMAAAGDTVIQVSALDLDSGSNGQVRYSLVGDKAREFRVDPVTGIVQLSATLDREKVDSYVLRVQAHDAGTPVLSSVAVVHVAVTDANDNPPAFRQPNVTAILQEDKPAGWAVCQLVVTDADIFPNAAPFIFEILYDDSGGKFRIDSKGVLQTLTQFSLHSTFHLQVRVYDNGSPPMFSDSWITIKVVEESRHPPQALPLEITVVAYEDRWSGGELGQVHAWDIDPYDSLSYELSPASALFAIDPRLGVIMAPSGLDAGRHLLNVSVSDGKLFVQVQVEVLVRPVWEEDLQNAVSIRLAGVSPENFLLKERLKLITAVETKLLRNVSIGSIQKASSKYLDVLLIITGGIDLATVEEILQTVEVRSVTATCRCRNSSKCRQRVQMLSEKQSKVQTNSTVFISPAYSFTLYCVCALGFTEPNLENPLPPVVAPGEFCEDHVSASDCACSGAQACLNPPCVAPSCSNNHSCFPPNISSSQPISPEEIFGISITALAIVFVVALFVIYRRCSGAAGTAKHRRHHIKPPGALDKLDITQISGSSNCPQDILAGISLNSLPRAQVQTRSDHDTDQVDEVKVGVQHEEAVESYGFPSRRHGSPNLPDLQLQQPL